jgi:allophanate hydrolase
MTPSLHDVADNVLRRIESSPHENVWISRVSADDLHARAEELERHRATGEPLPLLGETFAVKDNIDVAGMPTSAACPAFAYTPERHATVVRKLLDAGAMLVGKTNMDQFATGLVGTRSPYGVCRNVHDRDYIAGGSSSGSAVSVAAGLVTFALGTDTAGSGRVPAALNGIVGMKPTRGRISTGGVVPACRSLDCISVFARSIAEARSVMRVASGFDEADVYSRRALSGTPFPSQFRFGVPRDEQLRFYGDDAARALYDQAVVRLQSIGGRRVTIDYEPFDDAAKLLYGGPWVAERYAAVGGFVAAQPQAVHPVVRAIIEGATTFSAADAFDEMYSLETLRRRTQSTWDAVDVLALPTTGTIYRVDDVLADPFTLNANLGYYTNFVNLLDLCALAVPAGERPNRLPFGISLIAPAWQDEPLLSLGARYDGSADAVEPVAAVDRVNLAVVGAHLSGMPLNHQLTSRAARLMLAGKTSPRYRLYALANTTPPKPGLVHVGGAVEGGASIAVEVWSMSTEAFGAFVAEVPPPLAIGTVELEDGSAVKGFVCEHRATAGATDITRFGGWRAYVTRER